MILIPSVLFGATADVMAVPVSGARATALSADGRTLVGTTERRAFAWRRSEIADGHGVVEILSDPGAALAVSDDGSVIVGNGIQPGWRETEQRRWIGTIPSLPPPFGPRIGGIAAGVSGDGRVIVGETILNYEIQGRAGRRAVGHGEAAFFRDVPRSEEAAQPSNDADGAEEEARSARIPQEPKVQGLGLGWGSASTAVSRDGTSIVGVLPRPGTGFRWTEAEGALPIGDLPGGGLETIPYALDANGRTIVGSALSKAGIEAFRWSAEEGLIGLGDLPQGAFRSVARAVSSDGHLIVGTGRGAKGDRAFLWDAEHGMRDLSDLLADEGGDRPEGFAGWILAEAVAVRVTSDGHAQIVGNGKDASGHSVAFIATLGERVAS